MGAAGCARAPPPPPPSALRPKVAWEGGWGRRCGLCRRPPLPPQLFQSRCLLLMSSKFAPPRPLDSAAHGTGREDGEGGAGGGGPWGEGGRGSGVENQAKPSPLLGLRVLSPTRVRPQRGVPDQEPGAWPAGPLPGSRHAPLGRADLEAGAHGPAGVWALSSWPGLGLELAPGGEWGAPREVDPYHPPTPGAAETHALTVSPACQVLPHEEGRTPLMGRPWLWPNGLSILVKELPH